MSGYRDPLLATTIPIALLKSAVSLTGTGPSIQWREIQLNGQFPGRQNSVAEAPAHFPGTGRRLKAGGILQPARASPGPNKSGGPWTWGCRAVGTGQ